MDTNSLRAIASHFLAVAIFVLIMMLAAEILPFVFLIIWQWLSGSGVGHWT